MTFFKANKLALAASLAAALCIAIPTEPVLAAQDGPASGPIATPAKLTKKVMDERYELLKAALHDLGSRPDLFTNPELNSLLAGFAARLNEISAFPHDPDPTDPFYAQIQDRLNNFEIIERTMLPKLLAALRTSRSDRLAKRYDSILQGKDWLKASNMAGPLEDYLRSVIKCGEIVQTMNSKNLIASHEVIKQSGIGKFFQAPSNVMTASFGSDIINLDAHLKPIENDKLNKFDKDAESAKGQAKLMKQRVEMAREQTKGTQFISEFETVANEYSLIIRRLEEFYDKAHELVIELKTDDSLAAVRNAYFPWTGDQLNGVHMTEKSTSGYPDYQNRLRRVYMGTCSGAYQKKMQIIQGVLLQQNADYKHPVIYTWYGGY